MRLLPLLTPPLIIAGFMYLFMQRRRERATNAPLRGEIGRQRGEIGAQAGFETKLYRASVLGTGGLGGPRGYWIPLRGPKRLVVGLDAFMVSAPQALREFAFTGRETSIASTRMPARLTGRDRDWIVITGPSGGRQVELAITGNNLLQIWQALAGTGATPA